jgi:hypothetical protein
VGDLPQADGRQTALFVTFLPLFLPMACSGQLFETSFIFGCIPVGVFVFWYVPI